jgi:hypothetical protein
MTKNKLPRDPQPGPSASINEIIEFWDTHRIADYDDMVEDVTFEIDIQEEIEIPPCPPST